MSHLEQKVHWWPTGDPLRPLAVWVGTEHWEVAVMDVGGSGRCSLLIDGRKEEEFEDWPTNWTTAPDNGGNASQRAEYEYEMERFEKNKDVLPIQEDELEE